MKAFETWFKVGCSQSKIICSNISCEDCTINQKIVWKAALEWVLSEYPSHAWDLNRVVEKELDEELA